MRSVPPHGSLCSSVGGDRGPPLPLTQPTPPPLRPLRGCAGISRIPRRRRLRVCRTRSGSLAGLAGVGRAGGAPPLDGRPGSEAWLPLPMACDDLLVELEAARRLALERLVVDTAPGIGHRLGSGLGMHLGGQREGSQHGACGAGAGAQTIEPPIGYRASHRPPRGEGAPLRPGHRRLEQSGCRVAGWVAWAGVARAAWPCCGTGRSAAGSPLPTRSCPGTTSTCRSAPGQGQG